ncbi:MAG: DUF2300 domain-containing protein [Pseudomonas sp.]|uniref:DUF2300 domain-containing protein n=1 Tax=Pseudomonas sp. TaxID=306 RepID=UPI003395C39A
MRLAGWLLLVPLLANAGEAPLRLALGQDGGAQLLELDQRQVLTRQALPADLQAPLGSLWKLFVYAYLVDRQQPEQPYACKGQDPEEVYCCNAGEQIERDPALTQSCGLYFAPARLQLDPVEWSTYWRTRQAPAWLSQLDRLQPATRVPVAELLQVLGRLPAAEQARRLLLDVLLNAPEGVALGGLGGRLRVKTWSWLADHDQQARQGGFAGWLLDGTPVWAGGAGTSQRILADYAQALDSALPTPWPADAGQCVEVRLFARYPLRQIVRQGSEQPVTAGALQGHYQVQFENGNRLSIESRGELFLQPETQGLQLIARLPREEYVARVLEREASARPVEAAKALAVAIRTYLLQNAGHSGDCLSIADSSAQQRVAPRPAGDAVRAVAAWTADLVLAGSPVTYHAELAGPQRLAWQEAVRQAESGRRYDAILAGAFPQASLTRWDKPVAACQVVVGADAWLKQRQRQWRTRLDAEPGYSDSGTFTVCRLLSGKPHVDRERRRIFVRGLLSLQDRLNLTHEYLHLAFEAHPNGQDEQYVERLARHLLLE